MRYTVLRGFVLDATRGAVNPGDVVEVEEAQARPLLARGCITPHQAKGAAPAPPSSAAGGGETAGAPEIEVREPEPEDREPRVRRGKG